MGKTKKAQNPAEAAGMTDAKGAPADLAAHEPAQTTCFMIPVSLIDASPYQTRRTFDETGLRELAANIKVHGMLQPVVVRKFVSGRFQLISGERRVRAAKLIDAKGRVPANVLTVDDATAAEMCVSENMQRTDLTPLEEAEGVQMLLDTGHTYEQVANRLGRTRQWVARRASLTRLDAEVASRAADPQDALAGATVEALEVIASMPPEIQKKLANLFGRVYCPSAQSLRESAEREKRGLDGAKFDTAECRECLKRSAVCRDLFDEEYAGELGRCLDGACFDAKEMARKQAAVDAVLAKDPEAVIMGGFCEASGLTGVYADWKYNTAKKSDKNAVPAYRLTGAGTLAKCYILKPGAKSGGDEPKQPTAEQKRRAGVVEHVGKMLSESLAAHNRPCPFEKLSAYEVLRFVAVFGTMTNGAYRDLGDWAELPAGDDSDTAFNLWTKVEPVFARRIQFDAIIRVDEAYDEALEIAARLFMLDEAALTAQAAAKNKKGK